MDSAELTDWMGFAEVEPFGPIYDDLRAGKIAAAALNGGRVQRSRGSSRPWQAADFFPSLRARAPEEQSAEEQIAAVRALSAAWGGKFTPGGDA